MTTAFLVLTTRCNRSCPYCFYETGYQDRADPSRVLPLEEDLLPALAGAGVDHLIFTGGEPLLVDDLESWIRRAAALGFSSLLLTNGDRLDVHRLERLERAGLSALSLSLDALGAGGKAPWDLLHILARRAGIRPAVITPVTRHNLSLLPSIVRRVAALGLFLLIQPAFVPEAHPRFHRWSLRAMNEEERARFLDILRLWTKRFGCRAYADLLLRFYTGDGSIRPTACTMGRSALVVDPDGSVFPCFHRRDLPAGNLLAGDPAAVLARVFHLGAPLGEAPCFGEHCISLFSNL